MRVFEQNVLAFKIPSKPYVVEVDMILELYLIAANTLLVFGPFDTEDLAKEWINVFENECHLNTAAQKLQDEINKDIVLFEKQPYIRTHLQTVNFKQLDGVVNKSNMIEPVPPIDAAGDLDFYALMVNQAASDAALYYLNNKKKGA